MIHGLNYQSNLIWTHPFNSYMITHLSVPKMHAIWKLANVGLCNQAVSEQPTYFPGITKGSATYS